MAELDAVRALLPLWARIPGLLFVPVAFVIGFAVTALAARVALPRMTRLAGAHWTERARAAQPARWAGAVASFSVTASLASLAFYRAGPLLLVPGWALALGAGVSAYLGATLAIARLESQLGLSTRPRSRFVLGRLAVLWVLYPQLLAVIAISCVVGGSFGAKNLVAASLGVAAYSLLAIWGGLPLARAFGAVHPASPKLRDAVDRAVAKTGITAQALYEIDLPLTNAFALPLPRWLVFTRRCVAALGEAELESIACHELGHVSEPTSVKLVRAGGSFALLPLGFAPAFVAAFGLLLGLGIVYALVFGVALPMARLSRRLEARADAVAGRHQGDAGTYATALQRLHECSLVPAVGWWRGGSHPHLYDRMEAAGVVPAYPRPLPPSRRRGALGLLSSIALLVLLPFALDDLGWGSTAREGRAVTEVALFGGSPGVFFRLAANGAGREPEARVALLRASIALRPLSHEAQSLLAEELVALGRCEEAWAAYAAALHTLDVQRWDHTHDCPWLIRAAEAVEDCD